MNTQLALCLDSLPLQVSPQYKEAWCSITVCWAFPGKCLGIEPAQSTQMPALHTMQLNVKDTGLLSWQLKATNWSVQLLDIKPLKS
jgi:hypothetical protein